MGITVSGTVLTADEYLAREACAETRSEYISGTPRAMAGASPEHVTICYNLSGEVRNQIRGSACRGAGGDQRVWIPTCGRYYYPDFTVTCGSPQYETREGLRSLTNPAVIFEVLSPATEIIDRGEKFECYREIAALSAYVLIAQHTARIELWVRGEDATWRFQQATGPEAEIALPVANCTLRLADIYEDVDYPVPPGAAG